MNSVRSPRLRHPQRQTDILRVNVMSLFTIENHINLALISITIAPSTFLALSILAFAYLYITHVRKNPLSIPRLQIQALNNGGDDRAVRGTLRRPPFYRRLSARLRPRKQRDRPVAPLWLSFSSLWLPIRHRLGDGRFGFGRKIQSASMATRRKRQSQLRLLE